MDDARQSKAQLLQDRAMFPQRLTRLEAEHALELRVAVGHPFAQILETARHDTVDLIVMGTHGRTGLAHVVLGSVAERVVRLAACPGMTVKATAS